MDKYTDEQIANAIRKGHGMEEVAQWEIDMFRDVIEELPPPKAGRGDNEDAAALINVGEAREGDRVRIKTKKGNLYEVTLTESRISPAGPYAMLRWHESAMIGAEVEELLLIERPAPPQPAPDPDEHPLILVHEFDGDVMPDGTHAKRTLNQVGDAVYIVTYGDDLDHTCITTPGAITSWAPARVVEDDQARA